MKIRRLYFGALLVFSLLLQDCKVLAPGKIPPAYEDTAATEFFRRTSGWEAGDGGFSIPLSDGRVFWTFGDSYTNQMDTATGTVPCLFNARNAALLQPKVDSWDWRETTTLLDSTRIFFENPTSPDHWVWPASGIQLGDTVYTFCFNLKHTGEGGAWGFGSGGADLWNKTKFPEMEQAVASPIQDFNGISFGQGFVRDDPSGYVYVYGSKGNRPCNVYVARFPISDPNEKWEFWDGTGWERDIKQICPIGEGAGFSISVSKIKHKYLLIGTEFSVGCDMGKDIYIASSDSPIGPFTERKVLYTIPDRLEGHSPFFYGAILHPQFINDKNEVLMTYSINNYGDCVETCVEGKYNPDYYRPKAVRVPLRLLDPDL